jgi:hypothetical protein
VSKGLRTVLIVVALAAIVWAVPSGGDSADAVSQALQAIFLAAFVLLGIRIYREARGRVELLGDVHRGLLYAALGLAVVAMAARGRLVDTGAGTAVWVVLIGGAAAMLYAVWQRWREVA